MATKNTPEKVHDLLNKLNAGKHSDICVDHMASVIEYTGCTITQAQAKTALNYCSNTQLLDTLMHAGGIIAALTEVIKLREPVFLDTFFMTVEDWFCDFFRTALVLLDDCGKRNVLKSFNTASDFNELIKKAYRARNKVYEYALYEADPTQFDIHNAFQAAWRILQRTEIGMIEYREKRVSEPHFSLKQIKNALKNTEAIDRYAQMQYIEYDYYDTYECYKWLIGKLRELENGASFETIIPIEKGDFTPYFFNNSYDMAEEGMHMNNCIAGYWLTHNEESFFFACDFKGVRVDVEICSDYTNKLVLAQCFEAGNKSTRLTIDLEELLEDLLETQPLFELKVKDKSKLAEEFTLEELSTWHYADLVDLAIVHCMTATPWNLSKEALIDLIVNFFNS